MSISSSASSPQIEVSALSRLINLPVQPLAVKWQVSNVIPKHSTELGPNDWGVVALLELKKEDIEKLTANTSSTPASLPAYLVQAWLVNIVQSKFTLDPTGKFYTPQVAILDAEQFQKSPLLSGAAFVISEHEILVYLQTQ